MSRAKVSGFTSSPLVNKVQRQRTSRHGKPHMMRKRTVKDVNGKAVLVFEWVPVPSEGVSRKVAVRSTITKKEKK